MRIDWAIPCRYCEVVNGELTMAGGGADEFTVLELPTEIGTWVALCIAAPDDMTGPDRPHAFSSRILGPDMAEVEGTKLDLPFDMAPAPVEGWEAQEIVPTYHHFVVETAGTYTLDMAVDGRHTTVPISVLLPDEGEDEAEPTA
jgi:hypothetical protein